jgi:hypothetical protein
MPRILSVALIVVFTVVVSLQISSSRVAAQVLPVTSPVTTPVTFANLVGKVTLRQLGRLFGNAQRIVPADDVVVKVRGFFNKNQTFQATTDDNGNYAVQVPAGLYTVEVDEKTIDGNAFFVPPFRVENVRQNRTQTANFQGLLFPHL